jgi:hypothetical protein
VHATAHELAHAVRNTEDLEAMQATRLVLETATRFAREFERADRQAEQALGPVSTPDLPTLQAVASAALASTEPGDDPLCPVHGME